MSKIILTTGKLSIMKPGTRKPWYTMRFVAFDPEKHFMGSNEAKEIFKPDLHISNQKLKDDYVCIYATKNIVGRGKNRHLEFSTCVERNAMKGADVIFMVPKKVKREAFKEIKVMKLPI